MHLRVQDGGYPWGVKGPEGDRGGILGAGGVLFLDPGVGYMMCSLPKIHRAVYAGFTLFCMPIRP